jgi:hypothetical protein
VVNNLVTNNGTVSASTVGGLSLSPSSAGGNLFHNNTVAYNGGVHIPAGSGIKCLTSIELHNSIIYFDGSNPVLNCAPKHSNVEGGPTNNNNIDADPQFTSLTANDFTLKSTSPCVDKGTDTVPGLSALPAIDLAGSPRQVDKVAGGAVVDMGAYEVP